LYGDRSGAVKNSTGNHWWIGTHIDEGPHFEPGEDVAPEIADARLTEAMKRGKAWLSIERFQKEEPGNLHPTYRDLKN